MSARSIKYVPVDFKPSGKDHQVVRVAVNREGEYSIPSRARPGDVVVDQFGAYLERVPTREDIALRN